MKEDKRNQSSEKDSLGSGVLPIVDGYNNRQSVEFLGKRLDSS